MSFFNALTIGASGLTAQETRMDVIADNIANINTTSTPQGGPYRREEAVFSIIPVDNNTFAAPKTPSAPTPFGDYQESPQILAKGVKVVRIATDTSAGRLVYDPSDPQANADGYVTYPNINLVTEVSDMMSANRAYQANVTAINASKTMASRALEIGK
jgi:flagellar basal-body rod protein FlgC